jgi:hypothetical protein
MHRVEAQHLRDRLRIAMAALEEIKDTARASEGVEFYAMLAETALARIEGDG